MTTTAPELLIGEAASRVGLSVETLRDDDRAGLLGPLRRDATGRRVLDPQVEGSLSYLWSVHPSVVPLPGIRTPEQAVENAGALAYGPWPAAVAAEVTSLLADSPERRPAAVG